MVDPLVPRRVDGDAPAPMRPPSPKDREQGVCVVYYCDEHDRAVPFWGSAAGMKRRGAKWPRVVHGRACQAPSCRLRPREAYIASNLDFRAFLRLLREEEFHAAGLLMKQWQEVRLEALEWREAPSEQAAPGGAAA